MIRTTPRDEKSAETRLNILLAAGDLINQYGVSSLTIKNICSAANVSNGTFFHYFDTKETLIAAYMHYSYDKYTETNPFVANEHDFVKNIIDIHCHNIDYTKIIGVEFVRYYYNINNPNLLNRGSMQRESYSRFILDQVQKCQEYKYIKASPGAEEIGADICMVAKGVIFEWGLCGDSFNISHYIKKMLKIYLNSIVTKVYTKSFPDTLR